MSMVSNPKNQFDRRDEDITLLRRRAVALLFDHGYTNTQIWSELQNEDSKYYSINPQTGKPWGSTTIDRDIEMLTEISQSELRIRARRDIVKSLRARGLSIEAICKQMAKPGSSFMINPATGVPYSLATIHNDLEFLRDESTEILQETADTHRARQLQELEELKKTAYAKGNLNVVLSAIQAEIKLLGTAMPERKEVDITHTTKSAKEELRDDIEKYANSPSLEAYRRLTNPDESNAELSESSN